MTDLKNLGYSKGVLLIVAGLLIAFFPGLISGLFYIIGGIILAFSIVSLIAGLVTPGGTFIRGGSVAGIVIGGLVIALPSLVHIGIPLIAGIIFGAAGLDRIGTALQSRKYGKNWTMTLAAGIVLLIVSGVLIFHPIDSGTIARILLGAVMVGVGVFNICVDRKYAPGPGDIIDVDSYTVRDDTKYLK